LSGLLQINQPAIHFLAPSLLACCMCPVQSFLRKFQDCPAKVWWVECQARLKNPHNEELWLAAVRTEQRAGNAKAADALMSKALQDCPTSGRLNAEAIAMAPRPQRRSKSLDALKRCNDDPHIIAAVAQLFWHDRKVSLPLCCSPLLNNQFSAASSLGSAWGGFFLCAAKSGLKPFWAFRWRRRAAGSTEQSCWSLT
jgi:hypothetical protein